MKKKEKNMTRLSDLLYLLIFCVAFVSCHEKIEFSKDGWNKKVDTFYTDRIKMVDDLIQNHLSNDLCFNEIEQLLGTPEEIMNVGKMVKIHYEVQTKYGSNIDPDWIKYLEIKLDSDSCFIEAQVIKLN